MFPSVRASSRRKQDSVLQPISLPGSKNLESTVLAHIFRLDEPVLHRGLRRMVVQCLYQIDKAGLDWANVDWNNIDKLISGTLYKDAAKRGKVHRNALTTALCEAHTGRLVKRRDHSNHVIQGINSIANFLTSQSENISDDTKIILELLLDASFIVRQDQGNSSFFKQSLQELGPSAKVYRAKIKKNKLMTDDHFNRIAELFKSVGDPMDWVTDDENSGLQCSLDF